MGTDTKGLTEGRKEWSSKTRLSDHCLLVIHLMSYFSCTQRNAIAVYMHNTCPDHCIAFCLTVITFKSLLLSFPPKSNKDVIPSKPLARSSYVICSSPN
jgi:hypothetical protein